MNLVMLIGNLVKDPEVRVGQNGAVGRFTIAVNDRKKQGDSWVDDPSYINIVVFGKQAENCEKYLSKGKKVAISGKIKTGSYQKPDGTKVYTTDVAANNVEFIEPKPKEFPKEAQQQGFGMPQGFAAVDEYTPF